MSINLSFNKNPHANCLSAAVRQEKLQPLALERLSSIPRSITVFIPPHCIDLSSLKIAHFVQAFSDTFGYNVSFLSNRSSLEDVQWIGCSEIHCDSDHHSANSLFVKLLSYPLHKSVLVEGKVTNSSKMLNSKEVPQDLRYRSWDDQSWLSKDCDDGLETIEQLKSHILEIGVLIQRVSYVAKRDLKLPFKKINARKDSYENIRKDIKTFVKSSVPTVDEFSKGIFHLNKKNRTMCRKVYEQYVEPFLRDSNSFTPHQLLNSLEWLQMVYRNRFSILVDSTFKFRQKELCKTMSVEPGGGFILAGESHLVENKSVEKTLHAWLKANRVGYLLFFDTEKRNQSYDGKDLFARSRRKVLLGGLNKIDLAHPKDYPITQINSNLIPYRTKITSALLHTFYDGQGKKKPGKAVPKKWATFFARSMCE